MDGGCLNKVPLEVKDSLVEMSKLLKCCLRQVNNAAVAVSVGASVDNADNNAPAGVFLGGNTDLLAALGARAVLGTHIVLVQGGDHVILGKVLATAAVGVAEPGAAAAVGPGVGGWAIVLRVILVVVGRLVGWLG